MVISFLFPAAGFPPGQAKFAPLYKEPIKKLFATCCDAEDVEVDVDGGKIIVQFVGHDNKKSANLAQEVRDTAVYNRDHNLTGEIVHQVRSKVTNS